MPDLGEDDTEGTVVAILVAGGDHVELGQALLEVETDKVTMEVPAETAGQIERLLVGVGDVTRAGQPFALITFAAGAPIEKTILSPTPPVERQAPGPKVNARPTVEPAQASATSIVRTGPVPAGPGARREARELGIDIADVRGTGAKGQISKKDVRGYAKSKIAGAYAKTYSPADQALPDLTVFGPVHRESLSRIQQTTARNMTRSCSLIPHAWVEQQADVTLLESVRRTYRTAQHDGEPPLTVTALVCKAVATALEAFPRFNAAIDTATHELVLRDYTNIGVAVDTERGLVVPVIRNAAAKTVLDLAAELDRLSGLARSNKLPPQALRGAGITITNLGGIGVSAIYPVVNWPEVAIIGIASGRNTPTCNEGRLENRLTLPLTLGFDHRVINGAEAARFLGLLKGALENPLALMPEVSIEPPVEHAV